MSKALIFFSTAVLVFGLSACRTTANSKVTTRVVSEPALSFSKYRTYMLAVPPSTKTSMEAALRATVNNDINTGLAARGITPSKTPDFYIVYHYTVADKSRVSEYNQWQFGWDKVKDYAGPGTKTYAFGPFMGNEVRETQYTQDTFILDFVDANSHKMFFRGTCVGQVGPLKANENALSNGIAEILRHVPVL